jgi:hypothetical protein
VNSQIVGEFLYEVYSEAILYSTAFIVSFTLLVSLITGIVKLFVSRP